MDARSLTILLLLLIIGACQSAPGASVEYTAVIERVETVDVLPTTHFSVTDGARPEFRVRLRVLVPAAATAGGVLTLRGFGFYPADVLGRRGDVVTFRLAGPLPWDGELPLSQVTHYKITRREPDCRLPDSI